MKMTPEEMQKMHGVAPPPDSSAAARATDPAPKDMDPEKMKNMPGHDHVAMTMDMPNRNTHAPDPALERPAKSEQFMPPMMPGMDTDMNDNGVMHKVWLENLEGFTGTQSGAAWDAQAWVGRDFDKLWVKSEGTIMQGKTQDSKVEALWSHAILPFWDTQLGFRHDFSGGPAREWAAVGIQGLAPYWFDLELTGYVGEEGRTAVRLKSEYNLYLTQRFVLKPEIEVNAYGKADPARRIGAGLSDAQFELRARFEFSRRFAPYVGYVYERKFAGSATLARRAGEPASENRAVAGVEFFF